MIRVNDIKIPIEKDSREELERKIFYLYPLLKNNSYQIVKKSIDARDKSNIFYVYQIVHKIPSCLPKQIKHFRI